MEKDLKKQLYSCFPLSMPPKNLFLEDIDEDSDIVLDIKNQFLNKLWKDIGLECWVNIGCPEVIMTCLNPSAFHYYVPSLMVSVLSNKNYLSWGLKSILPQNQKRTPKGDWWFEYFSYFSGKQKAFIKTFLLYVSGVVLPCSEEEFLVSCAKQIWLPVD